MSEIVFMPKEGGDVIATLQDVLDDARKRPKKAVLVVSLEDLPHGYNIVIDRAGPPLLQLALAARLLHRMQQFIDES